MCDCRIVKSTQRVGTITGELVPQGEIIVYCPLHAASLELLTALRELRAWVAFDHPLRSKVDAIIAKAEGK